MGLVYGVYQIHVENVIKAIYQPYMYQDHSFPAHGRWMGVVYGVYQAGAAEARGSNPSPSVTTSTIIIHTQPHRMIYASILDKYISKS